MKRNNCDILPHLNYHALNVYETATSANAMTSWNNAYNMTQSLSAQPVRMGIYSIPCGGTYARVMNQKQYELKDHLGNVRVTFSDLKQPQDCDLLADGYVATAMSVNNYYSFGMLQPDRNWSSDNYRFGFNGKENDNEVKGTGNSVDFGARIYDSRLGRWLSRDPDEAKYPQWSTYNAFVCNPIIFTDPSGKGAVVTIGEDESGNTQIKVSAAIYIYSSVADKKEMANIADKMQYDINNQWNNPVNIDASGNTTTADGKVYYNGKEVSIVFDVKVYSVTEEEAKSKYNEGSISDNFFEITEGSGSFCKGNTGAFGIDDLNKRDASTAPHEFGHLLNYFNSLTPDKFTGGTHTDWRSEPYSIMTLPIRKEDFDNGGAGISDEEMDKILSRRRVTPTDITRINGGKSFTSGNVAYSRKTGKGTIGSRSSSFKPVKP